MIVLDTSALVELVRGTDKGNVVRSKVEQDAAAVTVITVNEILRGAQGKQKEVMRTILASLHILPFDEEASFRSAELEDELYQKGKPIGKLDIFIASVCLVHGLPLITTDPDFRNVSDLEIIFV